MRRGTSRRAGRELGRGAGPGPGPRGHVPGCRRPPCRAPVEATGSRWRQVSAAAGVGLGWPFNFICVATVISLHTLLRVHQGTQRHGTPMYYASPPPARQRVAAGPMSRAASTPLHVGRCTSHRTAMERRMLPRPRSTAQRRHDLTSTGLPL